MKNFTTLFATLVLFLTVGNFHLLLAQPAPLGLNTIKASGGIIHEPVSFTLSPYQQMEKESVLQKGTRPGTAMHAGFGISTYITAGQKGVLQSIGDSLLVWQIILESPQSTAMGIVLEEVSLAGNARIFAYTEDMQYVAGPYTAADNNPWNIITLPVLPASRVVLEYQESFARGKELQVQESWFRIAEIIHVFQGGWETPDARSLGSAQECHININCPEGEPWRRQQRGVARMLMRTTDPEDNSVGYSWCSGSLINNTAHDGKPYFLTAAHCGDKANTTDKLYWQFYFNFERPDCENKGTPPFHLITGCELKSKGPLLNGSDFQLVLLNQAPPRHWRPYYNGWSRSAEPATSGVGIHQPGGDAKKISTYVNKLNSTSPTISDQPMAPQSAWQLNWTPTVSGHGVTQGGSSGSPLFNQNGLLVGTLTGGSSNCSNQYNPDYYGKFSYHWDENGNQPERQLKGFLDPLQTEEVSISGFDPYEDKYPAPGFAEASFVEEEGIKVNWYAPGSAPNDAGWRKYIDQFTHLTWAGPERATIFNGEMLGFSYPATLSKISHTFVEHTSYPWPNDQFRFKIYATDGREVLYESAELTAQDRVEIIHELEEPLLIDSHFYVAVVPVDPSGHPSTLMRALNFGSGISFHGERDNWTAHQQGNQSFAYLTGVYIDNAGAKEGFVYQHQFAHLDETNNQNNEDTPFKSMSWASPYSTPEFYRVYKNGELLYETQEEAFSYLDTDIDEGFEGFLEYYVTAVYYEADQEVESLPSNTASLLVMGACDFMAEEFPHVEIFDDEALPACWNIYQEGLSSWELTTSYQAGTNTIEPVEGSHFMLAEPAEGYQKEWLVSPWLNLEELEKAAVRFYFSGGQPAGDDQPTTLKLFVRNENESFRQMWNATTHPGFLSGEEFDSWLQAVVNTSVFAGLPKVQLGFLYEGSNGTYFALDKIEVLDPTDITYNLTVSLRPTGTDYVPGQVSGTGRYIAGERVSLRAYPNMLYEFVNWSLGTQHLSSENKYTFLMPGANRELRANFSDLPTSTENILTLVNDIKVYPNPGKGIFSIAFGEAMSGFNLSVYNSAGILITRQTSGYLNANTTLTLDLSHQPTGIYLLVIQGRDYRETRKISISR